MRGFGWDIFRKILARANTWTGLQTFTNLGLSINVETLAGTKTLVVTDDVIQWLDPNGTLRNVDLPAEASSTDLMFWIYNDGSVAGINLVVRNDAAATIATLGPGMLGIFACDGTDWKWENDTGVYYDAVSGKVGIGTTTPSEMFDINGVATIDSVGNAIVKSFTTSADCSVGANMVADAYYGAVSSNTIIIARVGQDIYLNGNVGIGTASPISPLDVNGAINSRTYNWQTFFDEEAAGVQLEAGLRADEWTGGGTNYAAANVTYQAGAGGGLAIATAGADDDSAWIWGLGIWRIDKNPIIEIRFSLADVTNGFCGVGLAEGSFASKAAYDDDLCLVCIDTDNAHGFGVNQLILITNDAGAGAIINNLGVALAAGVERKVKMDLTDTEQPRIWIDNTEIAAGSITGTVQAGTTMGVYAMVQGLSAAVDTLTLKANKGWQDE